MNYQELPKEAKQRAEELWGLCKNTTNPANYLTRELDTDSTFLAAINADPDVLPQEVDCVVRHFIKSAGLPSASP